MEGFSFIQNSMQNPSSGWVSSLHFSLISRFCVCQQLHSASLWKPVPSLSLFLSLWQLYSLYRIIRLPQAVVIGWVFKLFWQKESLPAWGERWKWTPHCAETWTPWHFPCSPAPTTPTTLTQSSTAVALLDLGHLSCIHSSAQVTSTPGKAISKYLEVQLYSMKSWD